MTNIGFVNSVLGTPPTGGVANDARQAAADTIGEIGSRVLSWVQAIAGGGGANTAPGGGFAPDMRELARGGDVYGLRDLGAGLAQRFGATPAQEGDLRRSLEGFTRAAVVQLAGLSGASPERQTAGIREALGAANAAVGTGVDGVIGSLDAAAATLRTQNGA